MAALTNNDMTLARQCSNQPSRQTSGAQTSSLRLSNSGVRQLRQSKSTKDSCESFDRPMLRNDQAFSAVSTSSSIFLASPNSIRLFSL